MQFSKIRIKIRKHVKKNIELPHVIVFQFNQQSIWNGAFFNVIENPSRGDMLPHQILPKARLLLNESLIYQILWNVLAISGGNIISTMK